MSDGNSTTGGISGLMLLSLLFIGLKLTHSINWSWWWVLAPTWIPTAVALFILGFALIMAIFTGQLKR